MNKKPIVYFMSLVRLYVDWFPDKGNNPYDDATELELKGFDVEFMSAQNLQAFYNDNSEDSGKMIIYQLVLFFVQSNKLLSFFEDEFSFIGDALTVAVSIKTYQMSTLVYFQTLYCSIQLFRSYDLGVHIFLVVVFLYCPSSLQVVFKKFPSSP